MSEHASWSPMIEGENTLEGVRSTGRPHSIGLTEIGRRKLYLSVSFVRQAPGEPTLIRAPKRHIVANLTDFVLSALQTEDNPLNSGDLQLTNGMHTAITMFSRLLRDEHMDVNPDSLTGYVVSRGYEANDFNELPDALRIVDHPITGWSYDLPAWEIVHIPNMSTPSAVLNEESEMTYRLSNIVQKTENGVTIYGTLHPFAMVSLIRSIQHVWDSQEGSRAEIRETASLNCRADRVAAVQNAFTAKSQSGQLCSLWGPVCILPGWDERVQEWKLEDFGDSSSEIDVKFQVVVPA